MAEPAAGAPAKRAKIADVPESSAKAVQANAANGSEAKKHIRQRPRLFQPFRALGLITNHVPFALTVRHGGKDATKPVVNIIACIGSSWTMWDADRMTLLFVGEPLTHDIAALVVVGGSGGRDSIFAASGSAVHRFVRGRKVETFDTEVHASKNGFDDSADFTRPLESRALASARLSHLLNVGDNLIALTSSGASLYVWSISRGSLLRQIALSRSTGGDEMSFTASSILHPSTYVDKVLIGSTEGHLQLYNFRTATLIHSFRRERLGSFLPVDVGSLEADESLAIVDLVQTPAVDVVAIVFAAGYILLHDIRYDEPVVCARIIKNDTARGDILSKSSISFRTDGIAHTMAVGTRQGDIILFDLDAGRQEGLGAEDATHLARPARLAHTVRAAHDAAVASVQFVQGQPLLISSGSDNAIKQWFFENDTVVHDAGLGGSSQTGPTSAPRLLKSREGHSSPPRLIRYVGEAGRTIVSAGGEDRSVRAVSVVRDSRSSELSQGALKKKANQTARPLISLKLPAATSISHSSTRSRDWDDLVTSHSGMTYAQSWSLQNARMGSNQLSASRDANSKQSSEATVTAISACGNFAFVGNADGYVEMYNVQSGRYRRRYDTREEKMEQIAKRTKGGVVQMREEKRRLRGSPVTGIVSDATNRFVAVSTMKSGLTFFDFTSGTEIGRVKTHTGISSLVLHRATNLIAALQDDLTIAVFDLETFKKVRVFGGFGAKILDATFSPDGRWLIATSLDSFVRTFDIPTSRLVDYFYTKEVATSVTFSPLGDFLATTHVASRGIFLWANRNQYLHLALSGIDEDEVLQSTEIAQDLPTLRGLDPSELLEEDAELGKLDVGEAEFQRTYTSKPQLFVGNAGEAADGGLVTLSTMPRSRWMMLLNLDVIKARNKPKEAPKKPERAPFFLPTGAASVPDSAVGKQGRQSLADISSESLQGDGQSHRLQTLVHQGLDYESEFSQRLAGALQDDAMYALFTYLNALAPPALDAEIRSLTRLRDITRFLQCMTRRLQQHLDFDAVQAMTAVALRVHADVIVENGIKQDREDDVMNDEHDEESNELGEALRQLMAEQYRESNRLLDLVQYCMGSLAFVRDVPLA